MMLLLLALDYLTALRHWHWTFLFPQRGTSFLGQTAEIIPVYFLAMAVGVLCRIWVVLAFDNLRNRPDSALQPDTVWRDLVEGMAHEGSSILAAALVISGLWALGWWVP